MKILIVVPTAHGGGAEFVAMTWARELLTRHHRLSIFTTARSARPDGIPDGAQWFGPPSGAGHLGIQRSLRQTIRRKRPDVVLALQQYPNLHAIVAGTGLRRPPVVVSERNLVSIGKSRQGLNHRVKVALAQVLYRRADRTVAISHAVAADMVSSFGVDPSRCVVVPNPSLAKLESLPPDSLRTPAVAEDISLVMACRLVRQKRPLLAVDAAAELVRRGRSVRLVLFGGGGMHDEIVTRAEAAGVVVDDRGWAENWFADIPAGSVHVLPSDQEGLANTLVEAAGAGMRSVAYSRALGVSDAVVPGVTGVLVREPGPTALADAIESQHGLGVDGAEPWLDQFTAERSTTELERVLRDIGSGSGATALQIGGAGDIAGGLSQVVRSLAGGSVPGFRVVARPTRSLHGGLESLERTARTAATIVSRTASRRKTVLAVHLSQGGSFAREGALAVLGATLGFPVVAHLHGSSFAAFATKRPRLVKSVLGRVHGVLTLSDETAGAVSTLLPSSNVRRLPNSVDVPEHLPSKRDVVVFGGVVGHRKGVDVLLDAWSAVDTDGWELWLCGPVDPSFDLASQQVTPDVKVLGELSHTDLLDTLAQSSVAVLPSRAEALPLFVLESMAAGNAVVASDVGGVAEVVDDEVGALVPAGDRAALAAALKRLLSDPGAVTAAGDAARSRVTELYGTARCHPLIADMWHDALDSKDRRR